MTGGYIFTLSVHTSTGGTPSPTRPPSRSDHRTGGGWGGAGRVPPHPGSDPRMGGWGWVPPCRPSRSDPRTGMGGWECGYPLPHPGQIPGRGGQGRVPPHPGQIPGWGVGGTPYWNSIACACYAAGGMPLAFTHEDFLVLFYIC